MSTKIFRAQKSELLLSVFYFMTFFILFAYALVFLRTAYFGLSYLQESAVLGEFASIVFYSFKITGLAVLLSIPVSILLGLLMILCEGKSCGSWSRKVLEFLVKLPLILCGLSIIFWLERWSVYSLMVVVLSFLIFPRLTLRWFEVARKVKREMVEASLSVGMSLWNVLYHLYLRQCFKDFLRQLVIVFISALGLITPFLYFIKQSSLSESLLSFGIFKTLLSDGIQEGLAPLLVLLILLLGGLNIFLGSSEGPYGEWNG